MDTLQQLRDELTYEYNVTKTFLAEYPEGKGDFAPHPKSTKLGHLVEHLVQIFGWPGYMLQSDSLDIGEAEVPEIREKKEQFLEGLDQSYKGSMKQLEAANESMLDKKWSLLMKGKVLSAWTTYGAIRHSLDQITHHRAQLGVYYRLNDIKVPPSYGPTADVNTFK